jgi:hypothetical protein
VGPEVGQKFFPVQKGGGGAEATQRPRWQVPSVQVRPVHAAQATPFAFGLHVPSSHRFLPFLVRHLPLSHFSHWLHFFLQLGS